MNGIKYLITLFIMGNLLFSTMNPTFVKGAVASDLIEVTTGAFTKGEYVFCNGTQPGILVAYINVEVIDRFTPEDIPLELIAINVSISTIGGILGMDPDTIFEYVSLIWVHNRTTLLPAAHLKIATSNYSMEASVLHETTVAELMDLNNAMVTINNFTSLYADVDVSNPLYSDVEDLMFTFALMNAILLIYFPFTILTISPTAQNGDTIRFEQTEGLCQGTAPILDTTGHIYQSIKVIYYDTFTFAFDEIDDVYVHYDTTTGLIINSFEYDTVANTHYEFRPVEIYQGNIVTPTPTLTSDNTESSPFPYLVVFVAILFASLTTFINRKKK